MRGVDDRQEGLFSYVSLDSRIPKDHPLRAIRALVDEALKGLEKDFAAMYPASGRQSIAPERLLRALLLQVFYSIRSERQLCEQLEYNLLFRWFVGLSIDDPMWDHSTFSKNRERLLDSEMARRLLDEVVGGASSRGWLSDEHFSVDGTLIDAWASHKSYRPKDGSDDDPPQGGRNAGRNYRGERRSSKTHRSVTDPEAMLYRKSHNDAARLCFMGHVLMENRSGLVVDGEVSQASSDAERESAFSMMVARGARRRLTLGADKAYDTQGFVSELQALNVTPHIARNLERRGGSAIDGRTTRHAGYELSQVARKRIEEVFAWAKTVGPMRKTKFRGVVKVDFQFVFTLAAYNLLRMSNLLAARGT